jgi:hypothetical protein
MFKRVAAIAIAASLVATAASAMTVQEFLTTASHIPRNPTALLRSDTRRLMGEFRTSVRTVRDEQTATRAAGRRPATCMPEKVGFSPDEILGRFNAIPASRRSQISVTQAVREWMAERYPCPA